MPWERRENRAIYLRHSEDGAQEGLPSEFRCTTLVVLAHGIDIPSGMLFFRPSPPKQRGLNPGPDGGRRRGNLLADALVA